MPAVECTVDGRRLGVSEQVRHLRDRERRIGQVGLRGLLSSLVTERLERRARPGQATLQRPWGHCKASGDNTGPDVPCGQERRQYTPDLVSHIAVCGQARRNIGGLSGLRANGLAALAQAASPAVAKLARVSHQSRHRPGLDGLLHSPDPHRQGVVRLGAALSCAAPDRALGCH